MRLILIISFLTSALTAEFKDRSYTEKLSFSADHNDYYAQRLFQISKFCQQFLDKSLSKLPKKAKTVYVQLEGQPPLKDTWRIIYFKRSELQQMNSYEILYRITQKLLQRQITSLTPGKKSFHAPQWLLAALLHNIQMGTGSLLTSEKFSVTRHSITNGKFPDIDKLIEGRAPEPQSYWLYRIYSEQCSVFLHGIENLNKGKAFLLNYLSGTGSVSIINTLTKKDKSFLTVKGRRMWYTGVCRKLCFNIINPYPPEIIAKKVKRLFSVTIARPGASGTMRIPLEELSDKEDRVLDNFYINFLESDFFDIYMTSSPVIRPALHDFIAALEKLKKNDKKAFKKDINKARKNFRERLNKQQDLNKYLDGLESKYRSPTANFTVVIKAQELAEKRRKAIFSNWYSYLDKLEKKLENIDLK